MWGGGFSEKPSEVLRRYTAEEADRRLLPFDIQGSLAHVTMLLGVGLLTGAEASALTSGLEQIAAEGLEFLPEDEDVHGAVERRLFELVGDVAGKLHTGRSRNDQVALDLRLFLRAAAAERVEALASFIDVLAGRAEELADIPVAGYTHLQQAQVTTLGHHLAAHAWMALRDIGRLLAVAARAGESPLGAGAAAGSSLPLDPEATAATLGLPGTFANSLEAVASRDLAAEYVFACTQAMVTLSRLAEELVLWASDEFGWMSLPDSLATGSSALPQKKNPDIAELARGRAAVAIGDVTAILGVQRGLPLAYNRDLQEDKRIVFAAGDRLAATAEALATLVSAAEFHPPRPAASALALDLTETLVKQGVPFRAAHRAVAELLAGAKSPDELSEADLAAAGLSPGDVPTVEQSLARRRVPGSGSPDDVRHQVERLRAAVGRYLRG